MSTVSVSDFRKHLPEYLAQVQKGVRLQVTSRGRVVAEVRSPEASADEVSRARQLLRDSVVADDIDPSTPAVPSGLWDVNNDSRR